MAEVQKGSMAKRYCHLLLAWIHGNEDGITHRAPVAQLVGHRVITCMGGREFDSDRTNTQGLKKTEEKVLPL